MPRPIRLIFAVVVGVLALQPIAAFAQGTFFLKSCSMESGGAEGLPEQQARWLVKVDKPAELKGVPSKLGKKVYYYTGEIAGRKIIALIDSGKTRTLYIDLDGDRDLSDEKPVTSKRVRSSFNFGWSSAQRFGPLTFTAGDSGSTTKGEAGRTGSSTKPAEASAGTAFLAEQLDLDYLIIRPATCRRGTIRVGEKSYSVYVTDANYSGEYGDTCKFPLSRGRLAPETIDSDFIAIDLNRNGLIEYSDYTASEMQPLTRLIQFQNTYYSLSVAADGSSVTLDPAKLTMGTLDIGNQQNAEMLVRSENGIFQVSTQNGQCKLPEGKYRLWTVALHKSDEKKTDWTLQGRASEKKPCEFEISADQVTTLKVGAPLKMQTSERSHRTLLSGRVVSFGASCVDDAGIEYEAGASRGKIRGPAPSVKIVDEAGKNLSIGQFEYG